MHSFSVAPRKGIATHNSHRHPEAGSILESFQRFPEEEGIASATFHMPRALDITMLKPRGVVVVELLVEELLVEELLVEELLVEEVLVVDSEM